MLTDKVSWFWNGSALSPPKSTLFPFPLLLASREMETHREAFAGTNGFPIPTTAHLVVSEGRCCFFLLLFNSTAGKVRSLDDFGSEQKLTQRAFTNHFPVFILNPVDSPLCFSLKNILSDNDVFSQVGSRK